MSGTADDVKIIRLTAAEWNAALQNSLDDLGITWEQLTEQAVAGDFTSLRARKLWLVAGPQGFRETAEEGQR